MQVPRCRALEPPHSCRRSSCRVRRTCSVYRYRGSVALCERGWSQVSMARDKQTNQPLETQLRVRGPPSRCFDDGGAAMLREQSDQILPWGYLKRTFEADETRPTAASCPDVDAACSAGPAYLSQVVSTGPARDPCPILTQTTDQCQYGIAAREDTRCFQ